MIWERTVQTHHLRNGLEIITVPSGAAPVVALQIWVGVGSAGETPEEAGAAHFLEHMVFKGTRRQAPGALAQKIEAAGGDVNAWTDFNNTVFHLVVGTRHLVLGLDLLADAVLHPALDRTEVDRERTVILEEIGQGEDSPQRVCFQQLFSSAFGHHPYGRPVIGSRDTVSSFTSGHLRAFHRRWYVPGNMTLVVAGDVSPDRVLSLARRAFRGKARDVPARPVPTRPRPRGVRVAVRRAPVREAQVLVGFHIPGLLHADTPALDVAATLLGQGDSGRLQARVLRERQLVTGVSAYAFSPHDAGLFTVGASLEPEKLEPALDALLGETFSLLAEPVSRQEVDRSCLAAEASAIEQAETAQGLARKAGFYRAVAKDPGYEETYLDAVRRVTPVGLRLALGHHLLARRATLSVVLPEDASSPAEAKALKKRLGALCELKEAEARRRRPPRAPRPGRGGVVRAELPNGLRLLVKREPSAPLVAFRGVWLGGLRHENARTNGASHLMATLLTRGTLHRTGDEIVGQVEAMSGSISGFTGRNSLGLRLDTLSRFWAESLDLFAECLTEPTFTPGEFERERALALQEVETRDDNPTGTVFRLFQGTLFRRHPYRMSVLGERASLEQLTPRALQLRFRRLHAPGDLVVSVVGDVEPDAVLAEAHRLLGSGRSGGRKGPIPAREPPPKQARRAEQVLDRQQAHVLLGFPGVALDDPDRFSLEVLSAVLSGQGGRLFADIRDRLGLVYQISAFSLEGVDPGYFAVYAATSPAQVDRLVSQVRGALARIRREAVGRQELRRAQTYLVGHHEISLQQRATVGSALAFNECYGLGHDAFLAYPGAIRSVTARGVQRVARRLLAPRREVLAVVSPGEGKQAGAAGSQEVRTGADRRSR